MNPIELFPETEKSPVPESLPCGRICDDHMREARLIQSSVLPSAPLRHYCIEIAFRFTPFYEVGGDFVDFFRLPDGLLGLYIGDVIGKGLPATMYGALVMGTLRGIHKSGINTGTILSLLNHRLLQRHCTDASARRSTLSSTLPRAPWPFPTPAFRSPSTPPPPPASPSAKADSLPACSPSLPTTSMSPNSLPETLLFATDGLHESLNPEGIEFCSTRMPELWAQCQSKSAAESLDHLFEGLQAFSNGTAPHDDIAAVVLKILT
ncbi:MAG: SpoIIE family protein phosphatase [Candidatus Sulfotelmatobacter sp.]